MSNELNTHTSIFSGIQGYNTWMKKVVSINAHADSHTAKYRLRVIKYYQRFGLDATLAAFPVGKSSIYSWQKKLRDSKGKLSCLIPKTTRPHEFRKMQTHPLVLAEICRLRKKHYRLGKHKIYPLLVEFCQPLGLETPKESTIGKIIKRNNLFFDKPTYGLHDPNRKRPEKKRRERAKRAPQPEQAGYLEFDTIETRIFGLKRYTITAIDVKLKIAYAKTFNRKLATNSLEVLKTIKSVLPAAIRNVQTDNGSEFEGSFDKYLDNQKIKHKWTYPNCPKINGVIERFNRSIQEEWLDMYLDEMEDLELINNRTKQYLDFYHHKRIHESLNDQTPAAVVGYNINYEKSPICV